MKHVIQLIVLGWIFAALPASAAEEGLKHDLAMPNANKEVMKITPQGLSPAEITFQVKDSSLFFVNTTEDSLITLSINFGEHDAHCASGNLKFEGGRMYSSSPIGPKDFAITCFPQAGTYEVTIEGLAGRTAPVVGHIKVEQ